MPGRLVTETLDHDGGRQVTVYVPSRPPQAVVFAGDGGLVAPWGELLESPALPSTLIVGAHRAESETRRLHEYSPVLGSAPATFDADVFAAHERFFVEDLRDWASARFGIAPGVERTAAFGVSAGAELALSMGLRHPDVYGTVLCASPGAGYPPPARLQGALPRAYLVAGTGEPFFLANAIRWADALRDAGADVVLTDRDGTHGGPFWQEELPLMVAWAFKR